MTSPSRDPAHSWVRRGAKGPRPHSKILQSGLQHYIIHDSGKPVRVNSKRLQYGPGTICLGFASCLGFGVGGWSYSNFLASSV